MTKRNNPNYDFIWDNIKRQDVRYIRLEGGTRSGKTYSFLEFVIEFCFTYKSAGIEIAIARKTLAALKPTAMKDFIAMLKKWDLYKDVEHNKTDHVIRIGSNVVSFMGSDNDDRLRGVSFDFLYCNEALELNEDEWLQLKIRAKHKIIIDYNPSAESHYLYDELDRDSKCVTLSTTYKDNPHLPKAQIYEIEKLKDIDLALWSIYGDGKRGQLKGLIFTNFSVVQSMPTGLKKHGYGLDFGFTNDPTCLLEVGIQNGEIWVNELIYQRGLTNMDISKELKLLQVNRASQIIADSAEPKSIAELKQFGHYIEGVKKGGDSIRHSIDALKRYKINVTASSTNLIKELKNYKWKIKDNKELNEPIDAYNHAIDALRYWAIKNLEQKSKTTYSVINI